jgi:hypothetical protein
LLSGCLRPNGTGSNACPPDLPRLCSAPGASARNPRYSSMQAYAMFFGVLPSFRHNSRLNPVEARPPSETPDTTRTSSCEVLTYLPVPRTIMSVGRGYALLGRKPISAQPVTGGDCRLSLRKSSVSLAERKTTIGGEGQSDYTRRRTDRSVQPATPEFTGQMTHSRQWHTTCYSKARPNRPDWRQTSQQVL